MWHTAPGKGNGGVCGSVVAVPALLARLMVRGPLWYSPISGSVELTGSEAGVVAAPRVERRLHILGAGHRCGPDGIVVKGPPPKGGGLLGSAAVVVRTSPTLTRLRN